LETAMIGDVGTTKLTALGAHRIGLE
jgi:hypothetical protein